MFASMCVCLSYMVAIVFDELSERGEEVLFCDAEPLRVHLIDPYILDVMLTPHTQVVLVVLTATLTHQEAPKLFLHE